MLYTPPSPSALTLITVAQGAGAAAIDFTSAIDSGYDDYLFELVNLTPSVDASALYLRTSPDAGATWDSTAGHYQADSGNPSSTEMRPFNTTGHASDAAVGGVSGTIRLFSPASATKHKHFTALLAGGSAATWARSYSGLKRASIAPVTGVRFYFSAGNVASGFIRLYGLAKS